MPDHTTTVNAIDPILMRATDAAELIGIAPWSMYKLLRENKIESRYHGKLRLVVVESLREYAANLPVTKPVTEPEAS